MNMASYSCCTPSKVEFSKVDKLSSLLKLVAEPSRLKILCILRQGEHCVCEFEDHVGLSQSLLSHHLADLRDVGLISGEKKGLNVHYSLTPEGERVVEQVFSLAEGGTK
jgi:ArsR family transcriptional regulator, arsenate/arsenite/antimonite-responsive transcriptional repressor